MEIHGTVYDILHNKSGETWITRPEDSVYDAIKICDWCAENFPEFAKEDLDISIVSQGLKGEFNDRLYHFRFVTYEDDQDFPY